MGEGSLHSGKSGLLKTNPNVIHIILFSIHSTMNANRWMAKEFDNFVLLLCGETMDAYKRNHENSQMHQTIKSVILKRSTA
jgi:hypothetical protein